MAAEFGQTPLQLDRDDRQELVVRLAGMGMSTRAIAPVVGASKSTVANELSTVQNRTVGERNVTSLNGSVRTISPPVATPDVVDAEVVDEEPAQATQVARKPRQPATRLDTVRANLQ